MRVLNWQQADVSHAGGSKLFTSVARHVALSPYSRRCGGCVVQMRGLASAVNRREECGCLADAIQSERTRLGPLPSLVCVYAAGLTGSWRCALAASIKQVSTFASIQDRLHYDIRWKVM